MAPRVSVVIPMFQRRDLVLQAVQSVLRQTYRSFEVVVDDGSTDGTMEALSALGDPVRCLWQENRGVASARNAGIAVARSSIVAFLDSDDLWLRDHLETVVGALEQLPEAVLACTSPHLGRRRGARSGEPRLVDPLPRQLFAPWTRNPTTVAVRTEILREIGGLDERLPTNEDADLCLRVALRGPFAVVPRRTVRIRATAGSLWHRSRSSGAFLEADEQITRKFIAEVERSGTPRPEVVEAARGRLSLNRAFRGLASHDDDVVREALADACRAIPELSGEPETVVRRLTVHVPEAGDPREFARVYATAARLWPEPDADTALVLRCCAVLGALRVGTLSEAAVLLRGLRVGKTAGLAVRRRALFARVAHDRLRRVLLRGRESPALFRRAEDP